MVSELGETGPERTCRGMWRVWEAVISDLDPVFWIHVQEEEVEYLQDRASLGPCPPHPKRRQAGPAALRAGAPAWMFLFS